MNNLLSNRNINPKLEKRAICSKDVIREILNKAVSDKMQFYSLFFAYEGKEYSVAVGYEDDVLHCGYSEVNDNAEIQNYSSVEDLMNHLPIEHEITALYETIFFPGYDSIMSFDVADNYLLKDYLIDIDNPRYGYNMSEELENKYKKMKEDAIKENRKTNMFLIGLVLGLVLFFVLMYIFVWSKQK